MRPNIFKTQQFKGLIGNIKVTMQLYFYSDSSVDGCYFYDKIGELIPLVGNVHGPNLSLHISSGKFFIPPIDENEDEFFKGKLTIDSTNNFNSFKGNWKKKDTQLSFLVQGCKTNIDWCYFSLHYKGFLVNYNNKAIEQIINFIYPSIKSSKKLNNSILSLMLKNENSSDFKKYIDLINLQTSKSFTIINEYDNDQIFSDYDCYCWNSRINGYISYYNDSLLSYVLKDFKYVIGANGQPNDWISVFKISTGEEVHLFDILNKDYYDKISTIVSKKYGEKYFNDSIVSYHFDSFQVAPGGLYLIESALCNVCIASTYFLTFKDLEPFINEPYKYLIKK
jgi:hypothetical protein